MPYELYPIPADLPRSFDFREAIALSSRSYKPPCHICPGTFSSTCYSGSGKLRPESEDPSFFLLCFPLSTLTSSSHLSKPGPYTLPLSCISADVRSPRSILLSVT